MTDYAQAREALATGNARRLAMARSNASLKRLPADEAFRRAAAIVTEPDADQGAIPVSRLLAACPRLGEVGVEHALMYAGIMAPRKRLRDLTVRQRDKLAEALRTAADLGAVSGLRALRRGEIPT